MPGAITLERILRAYIRCIDNALERGRIFS
jgi:hypothetical protein